jgi:enoyl-CoA hydratase
MPGVHIQQGSGKEGRITRLILDRPDQRNAVSAAVLAELVSALGALAVDPGTRVVVLSGEGPDFCAGADVTELAEAREGRGPEAVEYGRALEAALSAIEAHPVPVIAQVQGAALGAGCQLVVVCDLAVAAQNARLGIPSARLGIVMTYRNIERLVLAVGPKRAAQLLYTGGAVTGQEAADWGLVNRAVPPSELESAASELAGTVADGAPLSIRGSKRGIAVALSAFGVDPDTESHRTAEFQLMEAEAFASGDLTEGIQAFRDRRAPRFEGR